jgi:hypothetical protein
MHSNAPRRSTSSLSSLDIGFSFCCYHSGPTIRRPMEPRFIPAHSFEFSVPKPIRLPSWVRSRPKVNPIRLWRRVSAACSDRIYSSAVGINRPSARSPHCECNFRRRRSGSLSALAGSPGRCRTVGLATGTDFVAGLWTLGGNGDPIERHGAAIHLYTAEARNRWQRVQAFRLCTDDVSSNWIGLRYIASCAGRA